MSLRGSLEAFALPDVLRLLAATRKTGHLVVEVTAGEGSLWLDDGRVAAGAAPTLELPAPAEPSVEVLFELLRQPEGTFAFASGVASPLAGDPSEIEPLLEGAQTLLAEWRQIQAVVPSLSAVLRLRSELHGGEAVITAAQWRLVVAIGGGTTVAGLAAAERLGEVEVSRVVKDLVESGFVSVSTEAASDVAAVPAVVELGAGWHPHDDESGVEEDLADDGGWDAAAESDDPSEVPSDLGASLGELVGLGEQDEADDEPDDEPEGEPEVEAHEAHEQADDEHEMASDEHEMANDEHETATPPAGGSAGAPMDRSSLLKMLSAVRT